ncbi:MAG TPA: hypothetical protein VF762_23230, partial [Blastocatellia bacterium]
RSTAFTSYAEIHVDYRKSKTVQVWFVALTPSRFRDRLGYIADPTKATSLTSNLGAASGLASVVSNGVFNDGDYTICEEEINRVFSRPTGLIEFYPGGGGSKTAYFDTAAIAHPAGTEIAVAKQSYPSLNRSLNNYRFTYPLIVARDVLQRGGDALVFRWLDVSSENLEQYLVYISSDADANTNVNKLGSTAPAWYLADPLTPPAGVMLLTTARQRHLRVAQEDLGSVGQVVWARVAARNGKRNFSSTLSATGGPFNNGLLTSSVAAAGGTSPPTDTPSAPSLANIIFNQTTVGKEGEATVVFRVFASGTDNTKTYAQTGATEAVVFLTNPKGKAEEIHWPVDDTSLAFADVTGKLKAGGAYVHVKNATKNAGGRKVSASTNIAFAAGDYSTDATLITGFTIPSITAIDAHQSYVPCQFTQPTKPVLLESLVLLQKLASESVFSEEKHRSLRNDATVTVAGLITGLKLKAKHPKNNAAQYQMKLISVDGSSILSNIFSLTSPEEDTAAPNNGVALTAGSVRKKRGGVHGSFPALYPQMNSQTKNVLIIHDNNALGTGRRFFDPFSAAWGLIPLELDLGKGS